MPADLDSDGNGRNANSTIAIRSTLRYRQILSTHMNVELVLNLYLAMVPLKDIWKDQASEVYYLEQPTYSCSLEDFCLKM